VDTPEKKYGRDVELEGTLRDVLNIEKQAQTVIHNAEVEAQQIVSDAQKRASEMKAQAQARENEQADISVREALKDIQHEVQKIQGQAEQHAEEWARMAEGHMERSLAYVLGIVTLNRRENG